MPTSTMACATPVRTSTTTAYDAQRDHTGTIAASSAALARGSTKPMSMTRPPSHTLMAVMCSRSDATVTIGTLDALGWPEIDQVVTPTTPSTASSTRSAPQPLPLTIGRSSTSAAARTPRRIRWAAPYWLDRTSWMSAPRIWNTPPPAVYGICRYSSARVASASTPAPIQATRIGAARSSRCGQSRVSTRTAPTSSTSPAYPNQRTTGNADTTNGLATIDTSASCGGVEGAPTEYV